MVQAMHPRRIQANVSDLLARVPADRLYAIVSYQLEDNDVMVVCSTASTRAGLTNVIYQDGPSAFESCCLEACSPELDGEALGFGSCFAE